MIGIVGPADSVSSVIEVAREAGRGDEVFGRAYERPEEATQIARSIDRICDVILFTGQVPFEIAASEVKSTAEVQVISHSGADLYRVIAQILIERQGQMPKVSVDSLDERIIRNAFRDVNLPVPQHVLPVLDADGSLQFPGVEDTAEFHISRVRQGVVEACLTCLASTHILLQKAGVPAWRIEHTRVTIGQALERAWLAAELRQSLSSQLAVVLVEMKPTTARNIDPYKRASERLRVQHQLLEQSKKVSGHLSELETGVFMITTSRGAIETAVTRFEYGHASLLSLLEVGGDLTTGAGVGPTFALAQNNARRALQVAASGKGPTIVYPDGTVFSVADRRGGVSLRIQETSQSVLQLAEQIGVGPLSLRRLVDAVGLLDHSAVTAQHLAEAYGVQNRSARRLLTALRDAGHADDVGIRSSPGAGRPQTVYNVHVDDLRTALAAGDQISSAHGVANPA